MRSEPGPRLTETIIGLGIKVHRVLGPGLFEGVYAKCLYHELQKANLQVQREVELPLIYDGVRFPKTYVADAIVEREVLLELKSIERVLPIHEQQTRTYLRLSGCRLALLMNFGAPMLKDGIRRFVTTAEVPALNAPPIFPVSRPHGKLAAYRGGNP
jgi:GxxExxY protein